MSQARGHKSEVITFRFEKLEVWKNSFELYAYICNILKKFPNEERFALADQLRRSSLSINLNIAEGEGYGTDKEFINYLHKSRGSLYETISSIKHAYRLEYITSEENSVLLKRTKQIEMQINALIRYLKKGKI